MADSSLRAPAVFPIDQFEKWTVRVGKLLQGVVELVWRNPVGERRHHGPDVVSHLTGVYFVAVGNSIGQLGITAVSTFLLCDPVDELDDVVVRCLRFAGTEGGCKCVRQVDGEAVRPRPW